MRILFTTYPAFGHFHPVVPLALAAQNAGHAVRVATGPNLVGWATRCGLQAHAVGLSEDAAVEIADREFAGPERTDHMFTDVWVSAALPDLLELCASWHPDLVVHEEEEYAGVLLAAMLEVPCVTQSWSAPARPTAGRAGAIRMLAPIWDRSLAGAAPRRVGQLYLDACPPPFQASDIEDIATATGVVNVRPGLWDGPASELPEVLSALPRPAVYVTLGTVAVFSTPELLRRLVRALAPVFASVVVTTGPNPVNSLGEVPANVHVTDYLRQSLVLPLVDVVVSHGGAGGTVGALMHGLPHLVLPGHGQSQITSAEAVHRVGVGLRLSPGERDESHIREATHRLLAEPEFAAAAARLRDQLDTLPDAADVVSLFESSFV